MKNSKPQAYAAIIIALLIISTFFTSCKKSVPGCTDSTATNYNSSATEADPNHPCTFTGYVMFWQNADNGQILVQVDGKTKSGGITMYYAGGMPTDCSAKGCATFILPTGTHDWVATNGTKTWSGNISVTKNGCQPFLLKQ